MGTKPVPPNKPLTPKQRRFVQELPLASSQAEAARRAGYSPAAAKEVASRVLTLANVQQAVAALHTKSDASAIASLRERKARMSTILRADYKGPVQARDVISAADLLNRMEAVYVDKSVNLHHVQGKVVIEVIGFGEAKKKRE